MIVFITFHNCGNLSNFISMKRNRILFAFLLLYTLAAGFRSSKEVPPPRAIICLTYDDALESHLSTVIPQLDSFGLKATFFINSFRGSSEFLGQASQDVAGWTKAAKNGHELGNHTFFHPCPEKYGWDKTVSLETYSIDKLVMEIKAENVFLSLLDPAHNTRSFAYPCNNTMVDGKDYSTIIREQGLAKFARLDGDKNSVVTDFTSLNEMKVPSWHVAENTGPDELINFAKMVKEKHGLGVYQFHSVGGHLFNISPEAHRLFLNYLKQNEKDYWVATFSDAMESITKK